MKILPLHFGTTQTVSADRKINNLLDAWIDQRDKIKAAHKIMTKLEQGDARLIAPFDMIRLALGKLD